MPPLAEVAQSTDIDLRSRENSSVARRGKRAAHHSDARSGASRSDAGTPGAPIFSASDRSAASVGSPVGSKAPRPSAASADHARCAALQSAHTAPSECSGSASRASGLSSASPSSSGAAAGS